MNEEENKQKIENKNPPKAFSLHAFNNKVNGYCQKHAYNPFKLKLICIIVVVLIILSLSLSLFFFVRASTVRKLSSTTALQGFNNIGQLATQEYCFTNIQVLEKARELFGIEVPFTQSKYIYSYDGTIKAGLDFEKIEITADEQNHVIKIKLPEASILSVEIDPDSYKLYNEGENLFTPLKLDDVNDALAEIKQTATENAINNGLLEKTTENAKVLIKAFLASYYDSAIYSFEFETE